jgi:hypothetical protein
MQDVVGVWLWWGRPRWELALQGPKPLIISQQDDQVMMVYDAE